MSLPFFIVFVVIWCLVGVILLALAIRAYAIRLRISLPLRKVIAMNEYQEIFTTMTRLSSGLRPKGGRLTKKIRSPFPRALVQNRIVSALFLRPPTFNATRIHLPYAYANLSEVSRRRFRKDPNLLTYLKGIFLQLNRAVFQNQVGAYCHYLAEYYRLMRFPERKSCQAIQSREEFDKNLVNNLRQVHAALEDADIFGAYQIILPWGSDETFFRLGDQELLAVSYLTARLESMLQGAEYMVSGKDTKSILNDVCYRIDTICAATKKHNTSLFLDTIG